MLTDWEVAKRVWCRKALKTRRVKPTLKETREALVFPPRTKNRRRAFRAAESRRVHLSPELCSGMQHPLPLGEVSCRTTDSHSSFCHPVLFFFPPSPTWAPCAEKQVPFEWVLVSVCVFSRTACRLTRPKVQSSE